MVVAGEEGKREGGERGGIPDSTDQGGSLGGVDAVEDEGESDWEASLGSLVPLGVGPSIIGGIFANIWRNSRDLFFVKVDLRIEIERRGRRA